MEHISEMTYNSQRDKLIIAEYGRHVQELIEHALTIEDKEERQRFTEGVIFLMYQMNPGHKSISEVEEKLWKHAYRISGYKLEVDPPEGITLSQAEDEVKPEPIDYPHQVRKYRHYGGYIQDMIKKAMTVEDPEAQKEFVALIGSYLKLAYKTWNKQHYANDEMIKADLKELTEGKFDFIDELSLDLLGTNNQHQAVRGSRNNYGHNNGRKNKNHGRKNKNQNQNKKRRRK